MPVSTGCAFGERPLLLLLQLREKLSEYQAENNLLGALVKELKVQTYVLSATTLWKISR